MDNQKKENNTNIQENIQNTEIEIENNTNVEKEKSSYLTNFKGIVDSLENDPKKFSNLISNMDEEIFFEIMETNKKRIAMKANPKILEMIMNKLYNKEKFEDFFFYLGASGDSKTLNSFVSKFQKGNRNYLLEHAMEGACLRNASMVAHLISLNAPLSNTSVLNASISGDLKIMTFLMIKKKPTSFEGICESENFELFEQSFNSQSEVPYKDYLIDLKKQAENENEEEEEEEEEEYDDEDCYEIEDDIFFKGFCGCAAGGHIERLKVFHMMGQNVVNTPLKKAIENGRMNVVEMMVNNKKMGLSEEVNFGSCCKVKVTWQRVFDIAAKVGNVLILDQISKNDPNLDYEKGFIEALKAGKIGLAKYFVEEKGKMNYEKALGQLINTQMPFLMFEKMMEIKIPISPHKKAKENSKVTNSLEYLFNEGVNINFNNSYSIFRSTELGCIHTVIHLLYFGSNTTDSHGTNLLEYAINKEMKEIKHLMKENEKGELWKMERHKDFPSHFKKRAYTFLLCIKRSLNNSLQYIDQNKKKTGES
eukprot:TRINITY_DN367_c1_g2_i1.p1 TRINITY_DN367_c1_g2~~TRINITY_DN367_c1_g2_i1.p1  ORF type:complete len:535 (+),score=166.52 TRINITY_DN367_c1_g2_i1:140-1744(+)